MLLIFKIQHFWPFSQHQYLFILDCEKKNVEACLEILLSSDLWTRKLVTGHLWSCHTWITSLLHWESVCPANIHKLQAMPWLIMSWSCGGKTLSLLLLSGKIVQELICIKW